jgi:hypothetical protein
VLSASLGLGLIVHASLHFDQQRQTPMEVMVLNSVLEYLVGGEGHASEMVQTSRASC